MVFVASSRVAKSATVKRPGNNGGSLSRSEYFGCKGEDKQAPQAFLIESDANRSSRAHFHTVNQWQIVVAGEGEFGRNAVSPITVHYARAFTPYGPIKSGPQGLSFFTLRSRFDPGAQRLPEKRGNLKPTDVPFQTTCSVPACSEDELKRLASTVVEPIQGISDEHGLSAYVVRSGPGTAIPTPQVIAGDGYGMFVCEGSFQYESTEYPKWSCLYANRDDAELFIDAGLEGALCLILVFPRSTQ